MFNCLETNIINSHSHIGDNIETLNAALLSSYRIKSCYCSHHLLSSDTLLNLISRIDSSTVLITESVHPAQLPISSASCSPVCSLRGDDAFSKGQLPQSLYLFSDNHRNIDSLTSIPNPHSLVAPKLFLLYSLQLQNLIKRGIKC